MKRIFIITTLCFICVASFGQDRVNRSKLSFNNEGPVLTDFTGWAYDNEVGEWVGCKNVIEHNKRYSKHANSEIWQSHTLNSIISLQFKTIEYNKTPYYVLLWDKWSGKYTYPHIREDWHHYKVRKFLIVTENDMKILRNLTNKPAIINLPTKTKTNSDTEDVDVVQTTLDKNYKGSMYLVIYKATDGSIRFIFRDYISTISGTGIEKEYFEISEEDYLKLIDIHF